MYDKQPAQREEPLDVDTLEKYVWAEITRAKNYCDGDIAFERARAMDYYNGNCSIEQIPGRSGTISTDVREAIDSLMPQLLDVFLSADKVIEAMPKRLEQMPFAESATRVFNDVFWERNDGPSLLHAFAFDGLVVKNGFAKATWEESSEVSEEHFEDVPPEALAQIALDPSITVLGRTQTPAGEDLHVRRVTKRSNVAISPVPTNEIIVSPDATSCDGKHIPFIAHRQRLTIQQLIEMGVDVEALDNASDDDGSDEEEDARRDGYAGDGYAGSSWREDDTGDPRHQKATYYECYYRIDADRDGITELRKICCVGKKIVHNEIVPVIPIVSWAPKPIPHEFFGTAPAEELIEVQDQKTYLIRQTNDAIALGNAPRIGVNVDAMVEGVTQKDLLNTRSGGLVRVKGQPDAAIRPLIVPTMLAEMFQLVEYQDQVKENRVGVSRMSQGLDMDALNKQTATSSMIVETNSQKKVKLYARHLAHGLTQLFNVIRILLRDNMKEPLEIRVNGQPQMVPPQVWANEYDFAIKVGMGSGNKDQMLAHLSQIAQAQMAAIQGGGMGLLVSPKELYNVQKDIVTNAGMPEPSRYWKDPGDAMPPTPAPPPNPIEIQQQIEAVKSQTSQQIQAMKDQSAARNAEIDKQVEVFKFEKSKELEAFKAQLDVDKAIQIESIKSDTSIATHNTNARTSIIQSKINSFQAPETMQTELDNVGLSVEALPPEPDRPSILPIIEQLAQAVAMLAQASAAPKQIDILRDENGFIKTGLVSPTIQ